MARALTDLRNEREEANYQLPEWLKVVRAEVVAFDTPPISDDFWPASTTPAHILCSAPSYRMSWKSSCSMRVCTGQTNSSMTAATQSS